MENTELSQVTGLSNVIDVNYLNAANASFERQGSFLRLKTGEQEYPRVICTAHSHLKKKMNTFPS